jgi:hypothetical protein
MIQFEGFKKSVFKAFMELVSHGKIAYRSRLSALAISYKEKGYL